MTHADEVLQYLDAWAPDWPRRATRNQVWVDNPQQAVQALLSAEPVEDDSPFISVYSFPRGHTKQNHVPAVNTLFIDFDFDGGEYKPGSGDRDAWQRDLSHLLVRARKVAQYIRDSGVAENWRASLSGHKGIHLFLDFPEVDPRAGDLDQFVAGMNEYANGLVEHIADETRMQSLQRYVDVTSSDMGRLCRIPNTLHGGAAASFGEERFCVPATIDEVATLTPSEYERLTQEPRSDIEVRRVPSEKAGAVVTQHIETSNGSRGGYSTSASSSIVDWSRVDDYIERSNDNLTLADAELLLSDMPCVLDFIEREDKFQYGNQSHEMESHVIAKMIQSNFPIEVIKEAMSNAPEYNPEYTERRVRELVARDFNPYSTKKLLRRAPEFMNTPGCQNCKRVIEQSDDLPQT